MTHDEFRIGRLFRCGGGEWRCTDVGSRVIVAIRLDKVEKVNMDHHKVVTETLSFREALDEGWFLGPPYMVAERVFDENDMDGCELLMTKVA